MTALHPASVRESWDETAALRGVRLELPAGLLPSYRVPGQYVKLRAGATEGYFAFANAPGAVAELLVKRGSPVGDAVAALGPGAAVEVSEAQGPGFPVAASEGRDLLLFAAGSGITPLRAVVGHVTAARARFCRVILFYGQRRPDDFAYRDEHPRWQAAGVELVPVVSNPEGTSWSGDTGHVQDALLHLRPSTERAVAFLCGMKPMVAGVSEALASLGLPRERVHLNY